MTARGAGVCGAAREPDAEAEPLRGEGTTPLSDQGYGPGDLVALSFLSKTGISLTSHLSFLQPYVLTCLPLPAPVLRSQEAQQGLRQTQLTS